MLGLPVKTNEIDAEPSTSFVVECVEEERTSNGAEPESRSQYICFMAISMSRNCGVIV